LIKGSIEPRGATSSAKFTTASMGTETLEGPTRLPLISNVPWQKRLRI
jgi:hypothetical protein